MTTVAKNLLDGVLTATLADTVYTTPALTRTRLTSCVVYNNTAAPVTLTVQILPATAGTLRTVISRVLAVSESYLCPEVINQMLNVGGKLELSGLNMIAVVSGLEITS